MKNIYVGTRIEHSEMNKFLGTSISRMNEKLSKKLRSSVLKKGIKKTEQGKKISFYSVDENQYQKLLSETDLVLVRVDGDELTNKLQQVNSRYPRRMDYSTSEKYKNELENVFVDTIEVVGEDKNTRKKPVRKNDYLYKNNRLGRLIYETKGYEYHLGKLDEFFGYIFYKGYVTGFSYQDDPQSGEMETFQWENTERPDRNTYIEYQKTYRFLVQWSRGNDYSRVHLYEHPNGYSSSGGYSHDGFSNDSTIITTKPLLELYKDYERIGEDKVSLCNYVMEYYSPFEDLGRSYFSGYEDVTWDEVYNVIENIYRPILMKDKGEFHFDTPDRERVRDILLSIRGKEWIKLQYGLFVKRYFLKEEVTEQDIMDSWFKEKKYELSRQYGKNIPEEIIKKTYEEKVKEVTESGELKKIYQDINS